MGARVRTDPDLVEPGLGFTHTNSSYTRSSYNHPGQMSDDGRHHGPSILFVLLALFIDNVGYCFVVPFLPQYADSMGMSKAMIGLLFGLYGVFLFLGGLLFRALQPAIGRRVVLVSGAVGLTVAFCLFAAAEDMY